MRAFWLTLALLAVGGVASAYAEEKTPPKKDPPKAPAAIEKRFKELDKNKDGKLTLEEYTSFAKDKPVIKGRLTAQFKRLDKDKDGFLTLEEAAVPDKNPND